MNYGRVRKMIMLVGFALVILSLAALWYSVAPAPVAHETFEVKATLFVLPGGQP